MTQAVAIRTSLFTLLLCNSIVNAQDVVPTVVENPSVPVVESESIATPIEVLSVEKNAIESNPTKKQPGSKQLGSEFPQARPGERVTNPAHEILNLDTKLGGVEIKGEKFTDFGYLGPGDMRTHLWNAHSKELIENGITEFKLMAMTAPEVQKWHNYFHGVEGSPEHPHDDHDQNDTIVQPSTMPLSPTYVYDPVYGTVIDGSYGYYPEFPQSVIGQPGIVYEQGVIIQESTPGQMQPTILNQDVIEVEPVGRKSSRRVRRSE